MFLMMERYFCVITISNQQKKAPSNKIVQTIR
jgi:hypothetical protein